VAGRAEPGAKNREMVDLVEMSCRKCGGEVDYTVEDACPYCGLITIRCSRCGYEFSFGE